MALDQPHEDLTLIGRNLISWSVQTSAPDIYYWNLCSSIWLLYFYIGSVYGP
jgi:hypothetical protein